MTLFAETGNALYPLLHVHSIFWQSYDSKLDSIRRMLVPRSLTSLRPQALAAMPVSQIDFKEKCSIMTLHRLPVRSILRIWTAHEWSSCRWPQCCGLLPICWTYQDVHERPRAALSADHVTKCRSRWQFQVGLCQSLP